MSQSSLVPTPKPSFTYRLVSNLLVFPVFRLLFRGSTAGNNRVPMQGPLVVVANHGSHLDPLAGPCPGAPRCFHGEGGTIQHPFAGTCDPGLWCLPVRRGASDREAIRTATARLEEGWATGVFLDGTRQSDGRINNPLPGAALLAARTGAPLLPVAIHNSHRALGTGRSWPRLVPIQLRIGDPIPAPASRRRPDLDATTALLQERINGLLDQGPQHP